MAFASDKSYDLINNALVAQARVSRGTNKLPENRQADKDVLAGQKVILEQHVTQLEVNSGEDQADSWSEKSHKLVKDLMYRHTDYLDDVGSTELRKKRNEAELALFNYIQQLENHVLRSHTLATRIAQKLEEDAKELGV